jgi:hypothetical protein
MLREMLWWDTFYKFYLKTNSLSSTYIPYVFPKHMKRKSKYPGVWIEWNKSKNLLVYPKLKPWIRMIQSQNTSNQVVCAPEGGRK